MVKNVDKEEEEKRRRCQERDVTVRFLYVPIKLPEVERRGLKKVENKINSIDQFL